MATSIRNQLNTEFREKLIYEFRQMGTDQELNRFTRLMLDLAINLSEDDVSKMKLALLCENYLRPRDMGAMNSAELLIVMKVCGLVSENDVSFLKSLLLHIHRVDLSIRVASYIGESAVENTDEDTQELPCSSNVAVGYTAIPGNPFKVYRDLKLPDSSSVTDDEKLSSSQSSEEGTFAMKTSREVGTQITTKVRRNQAKRHNVKDEGKEPLNKSRKDHQ